eukprot:scaffold10243_cov96-Skeletonema_dohrnii-CCMP3373.AAC.3
MEEDHLRVALGTFFLRCVSFPKSKVKAKQCSQCRNRRHVVNIVHSFWPHHPALSTQPCA